MKVDIDAVTAKAIETPYYFQIKSLVSSLKADENGCVETADLKVLAAGRDSYQSVVDIIDKLSDYEPTEPVKTESPTAKPELTLEEKISAELSAFLDKVKQGTVQNAIDSAYEITSKNDIEMALQSKEFEPEELAVLFAQDNLLDTLYSRWLKWDDGGMEALGYCIDHFVTEEVKKQAPTQFACKIGENYFSIEADDEGFVFTFLDSEYGLIDSGVVDRTAVGEYETTSDVIKEIGRDWAEAIPTAGLLKEYNILPAVDFKDLVQCVKDAENSGNQPEAAIHEKSEGIEVEGHEGTWYVVNTTVIDGTDYFLLEHEDYGDEAAYVVVDKQGKLILDDVYNGFDDLEYFLESENDDCDMDC